MDTSTSHMDQPAVDDFEANQLEHVSDDAMLEIWSLTELPVIGMLPRNRTVFSPALKVRQQLYHLEHPKFAGFEIRRAEGVVGAVSLRDFVVLDVVDINHNEFKVAVHPEWVWNATGQFIAPELASWSAGRAPELCEIIQYALVDFFDFFNWTATGISKLNLSNLAPPDNALYFSDQNATSLVAFGCAESLNLAELNIRTFSVAYRKNCLWLGEALLFDLHLHLKLQKTAWRPDEIKAIDLGDLLCLQQIAHAQGGVDIRARVTSRAACSVKWSREVYFRMTDDDSKIRMGEEAWSRTRNVNQDAGYADDHDHFGEGEHDRYESTGDDSGFSMKPHQFVQGMSGPEDVVLEVIAGVTQVNFNELCNIQEGSLIELQTHTLPMVRLAVRGVPILEGELVRFKDTVMVQVTQRIDNGSGDN